MIDARPTLVSAISNATSLTVYPGTFESPQSYPCITYREVDNSHTIGSLALRYSTLRFELKIYSKDQVETWREAEAIDTALFVEGFRRYASVEEEYEGVYIKVLRYMAIGHER